MIDAGDVIKSLFKKQNYYPFKDKGKEEHYQKDEMWLNSIIIFWYQSVFFI